MGIAVLKTMADAVRAGHGAASTIIAPRQSAFRTVLDVALLTAAVGLAVDLVLYHLILLMPHDPEEVLIRPLFYAMDTPALLIAVAVLGALYLLSPSPLASRAVEIVLRNPIVAVVGLAALVSAVAWLGASQVMLGFHLSRDEQMAVFDATIFTHGHLLAPVAPEWRSYAEPLQFLFTQFARDATHWISGYSPVNAAVRALYAQRIGRSGKSSYRRCFRLARL